MLRHLKDAWKDMLDAMRPANDASEAPSEPPGPAASARQHTKEEATRMPPDRVGAKQDEGARRTARARRLPKLWPYALGLVVFAIAVVALLQRAPSRSPEPADPEVVATYTGGSVTREQVKQRLSALPQEEMQFHSTAEGIKMVVEDVALRLAIPSWAAETRVDQEQLFKEAMKHITEEIQLADLAEQLRQGRISVPESELQAYFDQNRQQFGDRTLTEVKEEIRSMLVKQKEPEYLKGYLNDLRERASLQVDYSLLEVPEPTEQELLNYYQTNRARFSLPERVQIAQIQVNVGRAGGDEKAKAMAESLRAEAAAGADFGQLAQERSDGPEKAQGGVLAQWLPRGSRTQAFDDAVFTLTPGDFSPVFLEGDSYVIVKLLGYEPEAQRPYETVRSEIAATLRAEREQQVYAERQDRTLFMIHSRRTTLGEFLRELQEISAATSARYDGASAKRKLLDALIERMLLVEDASEQASEVRRQDEVEMARSDLLLHFLHREEVDAKLVVSDDEVQAEFEQNKQRYAEPPLVHVQSLRIPRGASAETDRRAKAAIEAASAKLRPQGLFGLGGPPESFVRIARAYSPDWQQAAPADDFGVDLDHGPAVPTQGWVGESKDPTVEEWQHTFHEALLPLKVGDISPVLASADSYYLFQVLEKREGRARTFEEAKDIVRKELEDRKHAELTHQMEQALRDRVQFRIYDRRVQSLAAELSGSATSTQ
jgi:parvulin-like peptidyl-prolyl isomerase